MQFRGVAKMEKTIEKSNNVLDNIFGITRSVLIMKNIGLPIEKFIVAMVIVDHF